MYKKSLSLIIFIIFISGCQNQFKIYNTKGTSYEKGLQYTKVKSLKINNTIQILFNATYLNSTFSQWNDENQNFLVGIYTIDGIDKQFECTLNGKPFIKRIKLDKDDTHYKHIPFKNRWATYYILSFPDDSQGSLSLTYTNVSLDKSISLSFPKE